MAAYLRLIRAAPPPGESAPDWPVPVVGTRSGPSDLMQRTFSASAHDTKHDSKARPPVIKSAASLGTQSPCDTTGDVPGACGASCGAPWPSVLTPSGAHHHFIATAGVVAPDAARQRRARPFTLRLRLRFLDPPHPPPPAPSSPSRFIQELLHFPCGSAPRPQPSAFCCSPPPPPCHCSSDTPGRSWEERRARGLAGVRGFVHNKVAAVHFVFPQRNLWVCGGEAGL